MGAPAAVSAGNVAEIWTAVRRTPEGNRQAYTSRTALACGRDGEAAPEAALATMPLAASTAASAATRATEATVLAGTRVQPTTFALPSFSVIVLPGPGMVRLRTGVSSPQWANGGTV
jgi:hypothetical protein